MLTVNEMIRTALDYVSGRVSLDQFDEWFENNAEAHDDPTLRPVYEAIEGALSEYYFDHVGQEGLRRSLTEALRPFERLKRFGIESQSTGTTSRNYTSANPEPLTLKLTEAA